MNTLKTLCCCLCLIAAVSAIAADQLAEKWQKRIADAEANYAAAVAKADNTRFYAVQKANSDRLNVLKKALSDATKAGDFVAASKLKEQVDAAASDGVSRPKPKNVVKFGGHEYALIEDKVTWHVAKRRCEELGGHLVTFESQPEQAFCLAACKSAMVPVWIGISNEEDKTQFVWVTGTLATVDKSWIFDNANVADFSWGLAYWPPSGQFSDHNLGAHEFFVCEWDK